MDKKSVEGEQPVRLCNYTDVYYNECIRPDLPFMDATASDEQVTQFGLRAGDVLVTKDSETADDIAVPAYVAEDIPSVVCGYHVAVLRPRPDADGRYLFWALASRSSREQFSALATGVTRFGLRYETFGDVRVPLPPAGQQRAIADYLDAETARIDALIDKKRRMVELLQERFWSAVDELVHPAGAPVVALSRSSLSWCDGPFGSSLTSAHYSASGARVVRLGNIGRGRFRNDDEAFVPLEYFQELRHHEVRAGDLLIAGLGDENHPLGRACVAPDLGPTIVKADCFRFRLNESRLLPQFAAWYLSSPQGAAITAELAKGSTRARASLGVVPRLRIPRPTVDLQRQVLRAIDPDRSPGRVTE